jgi:hypothetical protein
MGPGEAIWERFSHNAIWIRDTRSGTDVAYNWGIFDFRQEDFIQRLARGRMLYAMKGFDMGRMAADYRAQNRSVVVNALNLSPAQRLDLQRVVQAMDTDENRHYRYDYYRDNCSTRIRDVLDAVLGGQIRTQTEHLARGTTYRWHTRRLLAPVLWAYLGIQFVVGNTGDEELSAWDEMFLPLLLQRHLEEVRVEMEDGSMQPLLGASEILFASSREPIPTVPPDTFPRSLVWGLLIAAVFVFLGRLSARGSGAGTWGLAVLGGAWSALLGVLGSGLILAWIFTDHVFWRWNENLFQFNPLGLLLAFGLLAAARGRGTEGAVRWARLAAGLAVAGVVLQVLPGLDQINGDMLAMTVPAHLALAWAATRLVPARGTAPGSQP